MTKRMLPGLLLLTAAAAAPLSLLQAGWADIPLKSRVAGADVVVVGTIARIKRGFTRGRYFALGQIKITEVLKGDRRLRGGDLAFPGTDPAKPDAPAVVNSTDIRYSEGQTGIWILRKDKQRNCYWATYPKDYQKPGQLEKVRELLQIQPKPAGKPAPRALARAKSLKDNIQHFQLHLKHYGPADKPYYGLVLGCGRAFAQYLKALRKPDPFHPHVEISTKLTEALIAHLAQEGFLNNATNPLRGDPRGRRRSWPPRGPAYVLRVHGSSEGILCEELGWGMKMLKRLEALRKAIAAGEKPTGGRSPGTGTMDKLIGRLEGHRSKWAAASAMFWAASSPARPSTRPSSGRSATLATPRSCLSW